MLIPNSYPIESLEEEFFIHSRDSREEEDAQMAQELSLPKENTEYGSVGGGCFSRKSHIEVSAAIFADIQYFGPFCA